eukprot:1151148-Pelagomonas_calceolata.AAC.3
MHELNKRRGISAQKENKAPEAVRPSRFLEGRGYGGTPAAELLPSTGQGTLHKRVQQKSPGVNNLQPDQSNQEGATEEPWCQ